MLRIFFLTLLVSTIPATTQIAGDENLAPKKQTLCPVMTAIEVDDTAKVVRYKGVRILLCCDTCVSKWRDDPEAYLIPELLPQLKGMTLPKRAIAQVYCPVYKNRVVSARDPFVMYKGVKVYLFNQAALKKWQADPDKYADEKLLPQLKGVAK